MEKWVIYILCFFIVLGLLLWVFEPWNTVISNKHDALVQEADSATNWETLREVENSCRAMVSNYKADVLIYEQYINSTDHKDWAEQARIRANKTAAQYNEYILKNNYVWKYGIPDDIEEEIEEIMDSDKLTDFTAVKDKIGVSEIRTDLLDEYVYFFRKNFEEDFENYEKDNFVVALDTANGATSVVAEKVFTALGIKHYILNNTPNGININENCGSTHLDVLKKYVVENKCNLGIAYDGDGDRCLAVDENGEEIDGDKLIAIISNYLKEKGKLANNAIVATVMSNLGLKKYAENNGITIKQTKVGDRYVLEEMLKNGYNVGGEQSGHVILLDYNPTGDGILTSLMLIKVMLEKKKSASELCKIIKMYPQVLVNAKVSAEKKKDYENDEEIQKAIKELEEEFSGNGRVLIRPSGTEPVIRVMLEGEDQAYLQTRAENLAKLIEKKLK